MFLGLGIAP
uniref:Uncharacterized protein n=1 Tax=Moniliophthora roreri TaxID=221103 RepID=A0A0W0FNR5_MONRR